MGKDQITWGAVVLALLVALTGCGGTNSAPPQPGAQVAQFDDTSQSTCFTPLDPEQENELRAYAAQNQDTVKETTNSVGDQSLCILESDGNGGYNQRYYQREDESNFDDYLLYSLLLGRSNALLTYGLLSGDLDPSQAIALSLLTGVNSHGQVYHPYTKHHDSHSNSHKWSRTPSDVRGQVKTVAFGRTATPLVFDNSKMLQVPPGFVAKPIPAPTDKVVEYAKGPGGKTVVKSQSDKGAKTIIDEQKKAKQGSKQNGAAPGQPSGSNDKKNNGSSTQKQNGGSSTQKNNGSSSNKSSGGSSSKSSSAKK